MKAQLQLASSALALAGLMVGVAAHATNIAELPLKMAVLAKPNIIFALDDSGSMDWELLLGTRNGYLWWDDAGSAWDSVNNRPRTDTTNNRGMSYLFPMGVGANNGGQLYNIGTDYGRVAPPIAQLAWARSSAFNPLYYNTSVNYPAWAPAYVSGALRTYSNASTTAAPSHPGPLSGTVTTLNVGSDWNSSSTNFTTANFRFSVMPGMALPIGTVVNATTSTSGVCSGGTAQTLTAVTIVPTGARCQASIPYFPATFWQRTVCPANDPGCVVAPDCTVENPAVNPNASCIASPDGVGKLRRYEIKTGNTFPSGRSAADELQNFANWFTYYRKRKLMLAGAMGRSLESITGVRMGTVAFCEDTAGNPCIAPTMFDADSTNPANNRRAVAGYFYLNAQAAEGTPTHATMKYVAGQFNTNTSVVQYACQRNSLFVMTDGFSNTATTTPPAWDAGKSANTWGAAAPYQTTINGSLADLGLRYYTNRLRASGASALPAGRVPSGDPARVNPDLNTDLHITTYGITLGARGTLYPNALNPFATDIFATPPTWPAPVADSPQMIDDLWHATVNGRGQMYLANDVEATRLAIRSALDDILSQDGAQGGIAVSAVNLDRSDSQAYLGVYNPRGWSGDLTANPIDINTAVISTTPNWSASALLTARDWNTRVIVTSSGSSGIDFSTANVGAFVNPDAATYTNAQVVDFLRGSRAGEGDAVRQRSSLLGAVINAEPVLARDEGMVYLASGEGMLHAFDTATGAEQWAYVPQDLWSTMGQSVRREWVFKTQLDATPAYARLSTGTKLLVGGLGAAGRSYYALDVSSPRNLTAAQAAAQFKWTFPAPSDGANRALMGYTVGKPVIARHATMGNIVLVTSGYDNGQAIGDARGRLWVLNATTGAVLKTFRTSAGTVAPGQEAGLAHISAFREDNGTARYVYGGDLLGNLWKFDLDRNDPGEMDAELLASLKDSFGNAQPITAAPELTTVYNQRVVLVGTGRVLDLNDFGSTARQSFYAIADGATLVNARTSLVAQTYTRATDTITANPVNWATDRGWYFDLPVGEQANTDPIVTYGAVAFVTNVNGSSDCAQSSYMYLIDVGTGSRVANSTFVSEVIATNATSSRVITLRVVNGRIIGTTHRSDNTVYQRELPLGQIINPSKNAWREVRR